MNNDLIVKKYNLLIGITGSVASVLIREIVEYGKKMNIFNLKIIITESAKNFTDSKIGKEIEDYNKFSKENNCEIYFDENEWLDWRNNEVLHIELRKWADFLLIAPLSSNTLAKIANGICDNLLTCVVKAWEFNKKPFFYALAMNTIMYNNKLTEEHNNKLKYEFGCIEIPVITKKLKCGDYGKGALAQISDIYKAISDYINRKTILHYFKSIK